MEYKSIEPGIESIITAYEHLVKGINTTAKDSGDRAYGGIIRAGKGKLVESIAWHIIELAWNDLRAVSNRIENIRKNVKIPLKKDYLNKIKDPTVKKYIEENIKDYFYALKTDLHVHVDGNFVMAVECKAYTENAMLKRILVDCTLLKQIYPELDFMLFQLESQLGGDYSSLKDLIYGSPSTHTLLSHFDVELNIITLLEGERKVDEPIHDKDYYKPLTKNSLYKVINTIKNLLKKYK